MPSQAYGPGGVNGHCGVDAYRIKRTDINESAGGKRRRMIGLWRILLKKELFRGDLVIGRANILVVEDAFVVARRLQLSFERSGFSVEIAQRPRSFGEGPAQDLRPDRDR